MPGTSPPNFSPRPMGMPRGLACLPGSPWHSMPQAGEMKPIPDSVLGVREKETGRGMKQERKETGGREATRQRNGGECRLLR